MQTERPIPMLAVCCECGKARIGHRWLDVPADMDFSGVVTHGFCPHCYSTAMLKAALSSQVALRGARI